MNAADIWSFLPLAMAGALCVGLAKGGLPAVGMLAVPLLAFRIDPLTAAALLLPIYLISDWVGVWLYRHHFDPRNLKILIPAGLCGVLVGYLLAPHLSTDGMSIAVGVIGIFHCLRHWFLTPKNAAPRPARVVPGLFWGTMSGLTSFISHAGAPPYQIYVLPQQLPKLVFAGTTQFVFTAVNIAKLPPYLALGQFPEMDLKAIALLALTAIFGAWGGSRLIRIIPDGIFFSAIRLALFALSISLIWRAVT
ncbi:sulfite exporter TauE/SafE family protein [Tropicimonas aquimaris]|uniref:Probable membrane transporter protein n=1 Tax=Tropicimonas aquimaris TaxID=914152 RepID=A0ABW3IPT0_9RHOB